MRDPPDLRAGLAPAILRTIAVAAATAGLVLLAGGGVAFWLCVPAALFVSSSATRLGGVLGSALVVAAAAAPSLASAGAGPAPPALLAFAVPAASVAILLAMRSRSERERDALRTTALTDALTGIANRRSLLARIDYEMLRHRRSRRSFALVMLDLDGFKLLNDRFGHPTGDALLHDVATALQSAMRDQDTVARIGGDEFCVLAPETDGAGAGRLADRALAAVGRVTAGVSSLGASAGATVFPDDGASVEELLEAVDRRLMDAKRGREGPAGRRAA